MVLLVGEHQPILSQPIAGRERPRGRVVGRDPLPGGGPWAMTFGSRQAAISYDSGSRRDAGRSQRKLRSCR